MNFGVSSRADFFKELPKETVFRPGGKHLELSPKHSVGQYLTAGSPIIFNFPHIRGGAYDFSRSYLKYKIRIRQDDGTVVAGANLIYPANGIGHSLFKNVELYASQVPLTNSFQPYGLKTMIEYLVSGEKGNEHNEELWGYKKRLNAVGNTLVADTTRGRAGFALEQPDMRDWQEYLIFPNLDFFRSNSTNVVSLENVNWELRFLPQEIRHCFNWTVDNTVPGNLVAVAASYAQDYKIEIDPYSVKFFLRVDYFTESAYEAVMSAGREKGFVYNYIPTTIKTKTFPANTMELKNDNYITHGRPLMHVHTFVDHQGHNGRKNINPYLFRPPPQLDRMYDYFNGEVVSEQIPVKLGPGANDGLKHLYMNNLNALEIDGNTPGVSWCSSDMGKGYFLKITSFKPSGESNDLVPITETGTHSFKAECNANIERAIEQITYTSYEPAQIIMYESGVVVNTMLF